MPQKTFPIIGAHIPTRKARAHKQVRASAGLVYKSRNGFLDILPRQYRSPAPLRQVISNLRSKLQGFLRCSPKLTGNPLNIFYLSKTGQTEPQAEEGRPLTAMERQFLHNVSPPLLIIEQMYDSRKNARESARRIPSARMAGVANNRSRRQPCRLPPVTLRNSTGNHNPCAV